MTGQLFRAEDLNDFPPAAAAALHQPPSGGDDGRKRIRSSKSLSYDFAAAIDNDDDDGVIEDMGEVIDILEDVSLLGEEDAAVHHPVGNGGGADFFEGVEKLLEVWFTKGGVDFSGSDAQMSSASSSDEGGSLSDGEKENKDPFHGCSLRNIPRFACHPNLNFPPFFSVELNEF